MGVFRTTRRSAPPQGSLRPDMATSRSPPVLRNSVGGEKLIDASGKNVGDVLRDLAANHPATQDQLFSAEGELNRYVNVYLNDEDVRVLDGLDTAVGDADTLVILAGHGRRALVKRAFEVLSQVARPVRAFPPPAYLRFASRFDAEPKCLSVVERFGLRPMRIRVVSMRAFAANTRRVCMTAGVATLVAACSRCRHRRGQAHLSTTSESPRARRPSRKLDPVNQRIRRTEGSGAGIDCSRGSRDRRRAPDKVAPVGGQVPQPGDVVNLESPVGTVIGSVVYDGLHRWTRRCARARRTSPAKTRSEGQSKAKS